MTFFDNLIDDYLRHKRGNSASPHPEDVFYCSELGACLRCSWYKRKVAVQHSPQMLRKFAAGDLVHAFMREVFANSPEKAKLVSAEEPFTIVVDDFEIRGRADDVILARLFPEQASRLFPSLRGEEEVLVVVEVKSVSGKRVDFITRPSFPHLVQIHPYLRVKRAKLGTILYVARDTLQTKWFTVFYDEALYRQTLERARSLRNYIVTNTLPPAEGRENPELRPLCYGTCLDWRPLWRACRHDSPDPLRWIW
jgi:hypothetical protein